MDIYRHIVSFLPICELPTVSRAFIQGYVERKWRRLDGIPLLVDIWWHGPSFCHRYCVCRVANTSDRIWYYTKRLRQKTYL